MSEKSYAARCANSHRRSASIIIWRKSRRVSFATALLAMLCLCWSQCRSDAPATTKEDAQVWQLASPDGRWLLRVDVDAAGTLGYALSDSSGARQIVDRTALGLQTREVMLRSGLRPGTWRSWQDKYSYELSTGKQLNVESDYAGGSINVFDSVGQAMTVEFRLANDGLAYRLGVEGVDGDTVIILNEMSGWRLSPTLGSMRAIRQAYAPLAQGDGSREEPYARGAAQTSATSSSGWSLPTLLYADSSARPLYLLMHESGLRDQYYASHLHNEGLHYRLAGPVAADGAVAYDTLARLDLDRYTPWRMLTLAESWQELFASTMTTDLAAPQAGRDYAWLQPGLASLAWWSEKGGEAAMAEMGKVVDLASERGWPYSVIYADWATLQGADVAALAAYAKTHNVRLIFDYAAAAGEDETATASQQWLLDTAARRREMTKLQALGAAGIGVELPRSDKQPVMAQLMDFLSDAAEHELLVMCHACAVSRGLQRMFPNLMMQEPASRLAWQAKNAVPAPEALAQHTLLPFARNIVGSVHVGPVMLTNDKRRPEVSLIHQLALLVVYEGGIKQFAGSAEDYLALDGDVLAFLATVPSAWEEIVYLGGEPGEWLAIARRRDQRWYVAVINSGATARTVTMQHLDRLPANASWKMFAEGDGQAKAPAGKVTVTTGQLPTELNLPGYGGWVATSGV